jgi:hypothetical protein
VYCVLQPSTKSGSSKKSIEPEKSFGEAQELELVAIIYYTPFAVEEPILKSP